MRKQYQKVMSAAVLTVGLMVAGSVLAGSLDPTNAPGPTMKTLQEIYDKLEVIDGKIGEVVGAVPKTGQTTSYSAGDDGDLEKGVAWPSPRFTVQADTNCVTDNLTGLVWARNANLGAMTWADAITYCEGLTYGGTKDWRLPNAKELYSLIDLGRSTPALPSGHPFTGVQSGFYWSSCTYAAFTENPWYVYLYYGDGATYKTVTYYVWPVRGGQ